MSLASAGLILLVAAVIGYLLATLVHPERF